MNIPPKIKAIREQMDTILNPACSDCGFAAVEYDDDIHHDYEDVPWWRGVGSFSGKLSDALDYACENCETVFDSYGLQEIQNARQDDVVGEKQ